MECLDAVALAREDTTDATSFILVDDALHTSIGTYCEEEDANNNEEPVENHTNHVHNLVMHSANLSISISHPEERYAPEDPPKEAVKETAHYGENCAALVVVLFKVSRGGGLGVLC